ncbi:hypothetical protein GCM10010342_28700 [Streptomyces anulatus]|nr:hypothetical protein [Streptomyces anulatus]GGY39902.1 hypothetical protein GCM10010342_28700 [Streptomyces anulatus]
MTWEIHTARNEEDVRRCWPVFRELRPHIASEDEFVGRWKVQQDEAYRIVFLEQDGEVRAAAGFRIVHSMARGRAVYLDDLCALTEHRGRDWAVRSSASSRTRHVGWAAGPSTWTPVTTAGVPTAPTSGAASNSACTTWSGRPPRREGAARAP